VRPAVRAGPRAVGGGGEQRRGGGFGKCDQDGEGAAIIKNKAKKYIFVLGWLHGLCPGVFKRPAESTYENMRSHIFTLNDAVLLEAVQRDADDLCWSADHSIRVPSAARLNQLHNLVQ